MNKLAKELEWAVGKTGNVQALIETTKGLVFWLSQEENETLRVKLRLSINIFLERLDEITKIGGK